MGRHRYRVATDTIGHPENIAMRIGLFGGSFDPIHIGHLWIASAAHECLGLDELRFLPAAKNPLKAVGPLASDQQRLDMLRLAIGGDDRFVVDDRELRRGDTSYTVETLRELCGEQPDAEWLFIVGGDSLADFPKWHKPAEILSLASLACVRRGGRGRLRYETLEPFTDPSNLSTIRKHEIEMPVIEIASRDIRERIHRRRTIRYFVPAAVEIYLANQSVYPSAGVDETRSK